MRKIALIIAALALPVSACNGLGAITGIAAPIVASQEKVVLQGTKGLMLAELAYNSAASTANEVAKACLANPSLPCPISAETAGKVRKLNAQAIAALEAGKSASDEVAKAKAAATVFSLVDQIKSLIG